ncbi:MAG: tRNA (N6-isopentenyl adenosine(37)-C2)-methylthiotransferase MiaB [Oscillospiraceae bacterium]|nr:tRNA (N6-isopentenyl adenosine(37)-C2)-methylthiotransferase MiaB [Oscillospiraceae bacterium]
MADKTKLAFVRTFGCRANVSDGEKISGMLAALGYGFTRDMNAADLILFNTCAIRENAELKVFGNVGALIHLKRQKPDLLIVVCGCMVQQAHIADKLFKTYPFVNLIFGTHVLHKLPELLREVSQKKRVMNIDDSIHSVIEDLPIRRDTSTHADVPIMYGCDNYCTYCVVPYVRGRERSREPQDVLNEIRGLLRDGYRHITLLGQNVNSYKPSFAELLREIDVLECERGEFRVSFMTSHPKDLTRELIDTIADSKRVSHHLHLPIQSGSNGVLRAMNRGYTVEEYKSIVAYARERIPDISLTTDIIVGFPGESREDFEHTLSLLQDVRFDSAYTFIYSKREGTRAAEMPDTVNDETKSAWFTEMLGVLDGICETVYTRYVGKTLRVLCEGEGRTGQYAYSGRSREGVLVDFDSDDTDIPGKFVNVKIDKALKWAVTGIKE